jgi:hypothetical protein
MEVSGQASRPGCLTPGERVSGTHWTEGSVDPRVDLDVTEKLKMLVLSGTRTHNSRSSSPKAAAILTTLQRLTIRPIHVNISPMCSVHIDTCTECKRLNILRMDPISTLWPENNPH